ncbi:glutamate 5-kinase, partial [bacterium]
EIVESIDDVMSLAGDSKSKVGTGGMSTKLVAAKKAVEAGAFAKISSGKRPNAVRKIFSGEEIGTLFVPGTSKLKKKKHWLKYSAPEKGTITVDDGAARAILQNGKSLLPVGVLDASGDFKKGDTVIIVGLSGKTFAKGVSRYSAGEICAIKGAPSCEIAQKLGRKDYDEIIHRDEMVLMAEKKPAQRKSPARKKAGK